MNRTGIIRMSGRTARRFSAGVVVLLLGSYLLEALLPGLPRGPAVALGLTKIAALLGAVVLFVSTHGQRAQAPDRLLDERERAERDRAFVLTHQWMISGLLGFFIYLEAARKLGLPMPNIPQIGELMTVFTLLSMAMPGMILAFRDRAEPMEEE